MRPMSPLLFKPIRRDFTFCWSRLPPVASLPSKPPPSPPADTPHARALPHWGGGDARGWACTTSALALARLSGAKPLRFTER